MKILDILEQYGKETGKFQIVRCPITKIIDKGDDYYNAIIKDDDPEEDNNKKISKKS